jgi:hypothetical protein
LPRWPVRPGTWASQFFTWHNHQHHHSGLALLTLFDMHYRWLDHVLHKRQAALSPACKAQAARFVKGPPVPARPTAAAWINPPEADNPFPPKREGDTHRFGLIALGAHPCLLLSEFRA